MIDNLPAYPAYRDSGLPWVGAIPTHWDILRNGRLFTHRVETGFPDLPILEVSLRTGVRVRDLVNLKRKQMMAQKEKYKRAVKGDIAYNMMRMWQGALGVAPVDGLVSPAYVVVRPFDEVNSSYYDYLFRTGAYMSEVNKYSRGIVSDRNRLYWDEFKQMPSIIPPRDEQDKIVAFLCAQDRQIARFIRDKRRLIELLNEQKQTIIHRAVTRGLDPDVRLRPSGIDWLGDVPEHWSVVRLKAKLLLNDGGCWGQEPKVAGTIVLRSTEQTFQGGWKIENPALRLLSDHEITTKKLEIGDLVITKSSGSEKHIGKTSLVTEDVAALGCCFSNFMQRLRVKRDTAPKWVWFVLNCRLGREQMIIASNSTTGLGNLSRNIFGTIWIALPPLPEQQSIIQGIEERITPFEDSIQVANEEINFIREYRERLISDVVTGKVDLRGWTPAPEDLETDDEGLAVIGDDEEIPAEEDGDAND